jgi:hypothetical protein
MRKFTSKRSALLAVIGVLCISAAAVAYWTTTGSGTGTGTAGSDSGVTVTVTTSPSGLRPGSPAQAVGISVQNAATVKQYVTSVTLSITSVDKASGAVAGTCDATDFAITQPTWTAHDMSASTTESPTGATLAMVNASSNQDACKGATVNLKVDAA